MEEFRQRRRDEERQSKALSTQLKAETPGPCQDDTGIVTSNVRVESKDGNGSEQLAVYDNQVSRASQQCDKQTLGTNILQSSALAGNSKSSDESIRDQESPTMGSNVDEPIWGVVDSRRDLNLDETERVEDVDNLPNSTAGIGHNENIQFEASLFLIPRDDDAQRGHGRRAEGLDGASPDVVSKDSSNREDEEGDDMKRSVLFEKRCDRYSSV